MKISPVQRALLNKLNDEWQSAHGIHVRYDVNFSLATFQALINKGLATEHSYAPGHLVPRCTRLFRITAKGKIERRIAKSAGDNK